MMKRIRNYLVTINFNKRGKYWCYQKEKENEGDWIIKINTTWDKKLVKLIKDIK
jgi:hypothetical protein